jgi:hypothetical protein
LVNKPYPWLEKSSNAHKRTISVEESTGSLSVQVENYDLFWHFLVVPNLSEELIIGADFLQRWKIKLDLESEKIIIDPKVLRLKLVSVELKIIKWRKKNE